MNLITGGTGFLGTTLIERIKDEPIRVVARNEGNLVKLKQKYPNIEILAGDIADPCICEKACKDVDRVFHLAAFKHVTMAENQPIECYKSNCVGTLNMLKAFGGGKNFIMPSTDKAAQVSGVYGATKLLAEHMIKEYDGRVVRYGNVLYSTGSVLVIWKDHIKEGESITITDPEATRFFWTVDQAVDLLFECLKNATDSTPYCPDMKSMKMGDLLQAMIEKYATSNIKVWKIGLQPGENKHERIIENGPRSDEVEKYSVEEIMELI